MAAGNAESALRQGVIIDGNTRTVSGYEVEGIHTFAQPKRPQSANRMLPTDCHVLVAERDLHKQP